MTLFWCAAFSVMFVLTLRDIVLKMISYESLRADYWVGLVLFAGVFFAMSRNFNTLFGS